MNLVETKQAIKLIIPHTDCIAWKDFSDRGNSCTGRLDRLTNSNDIEKNAISLSNVKQAMPKYCDLHLNLSKRVASEIGANWVTYDWLVKILGRVLEDDFEAFSHIFSLSMNVKSRMRDLGLSEIQSLGELYSRC